MLFLGRLVGKFFQMLLGYLTILNAYLKHSINVCDIYTYIIYTTHNIHKHNTYISMKVHTHTHTGMKRCSECRSSWHWHLYLLATYSLHNLREFLHVAFGGMLSPYKKQRGQGISSLHPLILVNWILLHVIAFGENKMKMSGWQISFTAATVKSQVQG